MVKSKNSKSKGGANLKNFGGICFSKLKKLDLLGGHPGLNIGGEETYKTKAGGIWSLVGLGAVFYIMYCLFRPYFDLHNPDVTVSSEFTGAFDNLDITNSGILPIISIYDKEAGFLLSQRSITEYFTPRARYSQYIPNLEKKKTDKFIKDIDFVECKKLKNTKPYQKIFDGMPTATILDHFIWLEIPLDLKIEVEGNLYSKLRSELVIDLFPSTGELTDSIVDPADYHYFSLVITNLKWFTKFSDVNEPIKYSLVTEDSVGLNINNLYTMKTSIKSVTIENENDLSLFEISPNFNYVAVDQVQHFVSPRGVDFYCSSSNLRNPLEWTSYVTMKYVSGGNTETVKRKYLTLLEVLGNIGGVNEIIFLVLTISYAWYNSCYQKDFILKEIFELNIMKMYYKGKYSSSEKKDKELCEIINDVNSLVPKKNEDCRVQVSIRQNENNYNNNSKDINKIETKAVMAPFQVFHNYSRTPIKNEVNPKKHIELPDSKKIKFNRVTQLAKPNIIFSNPIQLIISNPKSQVIKKNDKKSQIKSVEKVNSSTNSEKIQVERNLESLNKCKQGIEGSLSLKLDQKLDLSPFFKEDRNQKTKDQLINEIKTSKRLLNEVIENKLDVIEIVKELNFVKVIRAILFQDYHEKLLPFLAIEMYKKEKLEKDQEKINLEKISNNLIFGNILSNSIVQGLAKYSNKTTSLVSAIENLKRTNNAAGVNWNADDYDDNNIDNFISNNNIALNLKNMIDDFYKENLVNLLQEKFIKSTGETIVPNNSE